MHEHPWSAKSWWMKCVCDILKDHRAVLVKTDLCRFGMMTEDDEGSMGPARKRTGFMRSCWAIAEELEGTCSGSRGKHNPLIARRAKDAALYPPPSPRTLQGDMQGGGKAEHGRRSACENEQTVNQK